MTSEIVLHLPSFTETLVVYAQGLGGDVTTPAVNGNVEEGQVIGDHQVPMTGANVTTQVEATVATVAVSAVVEPIDVTAEREC